MACRKVDASRGFSADDFEGHCRRGDITVRKICVHTVFGEHPDRFLRKPLGHEARVVSDDYASVLQTLRRYMIRYRLGYHTHPGNGKIIGDDAAPPRSSEFYFFNRHGCSKFIIKPQPLQLKTISSAFIVRVEPPPAGAKAS
jgi:hypothetical protein